MAVEPLAQAMLREGPVGSASGSSCWHGGVPAGASAGSWHQLACTLPPAAPSGLKNIVVEAGLCAWTSARSPSIQTPSLVTVSSWEIDRRRLARAGDRERLAFGWRPAPGTVSGCASLPAPPAAATGFQLHLRPRLPFGTRRKSATAPAG